MGTVLYQVLFYYFEKFFSGYEMSRDSRESTAISGIYTNAHREKVRNAGITPHILPVAEGEHKQVPRKGWAEMIRFRLFSAIIDRGNFIVICLFRDVSRWRLRKIECDLSSQQKGNSYKSDVIKAILVY